MSRAPTAETLPAGILSATDALDDGNAYGSASGTAAVRDVTSEEMAVNAIAPNIRYHRAN